MEKLLRYFIPILLLAAVTFAGNAENSDSVATEWQTHILTSELDSHYWETLETQSDLHFPCQASSVNIFRLQSTAKRTGRTCKYKSSFGIQKAGNTLCVGNISKKHFFSIQYAFVKPSHRLISLGRLII